MAKHVSELRLNTEFHIQVFDDGTRKIINAKDVVGEHGPVIQDFVPVYYIYLSCFFYQQYFQNFNKQVVLTPLHKIVHVHFQTPLSISSYGVYDPWRMPKELYLEYCMFHTYIKSKVLVSAEFHYIYRDGTSYQSHADFNTIEFFINPVQVKSFDIKLWTCHEFIHTEVAVININVPQFPVFFTTFKPHSVTNLYWDLQLAESDSTRNSTYNLYNTLFTIGKPKKQQL